MRTVKCLEDFILAVPRGRANKVTYAKLSELMGIYEPPSTVATGRNCRRIVALLNELGVPIVSDSGGVWMAESAKELHDCADGLEKRKAALEKRIEDLRLMARACASFTIGGLV